MTPEQFQDLFVEISAEVADEFYPKNEYITYNAVGVELGVLDKDVAGYRIQTDRSKRRGEYLRDQGVLHAKLSRRLVEEGLLEEA